MKVLRPLLAKIVLICQQLAMPQLSGVEGVASQPLGCRIGWLGAQGLVWLWASGQSFCPPPPPPIWPCLPFYSDLVGSHFKSPPFSVCRRSFCPQNWVILSFYSDLVGSHFELRAAHPYWFCLTRSPPPPFFQGAGEKYRFQTATPFRYLRREDNFTILYPFRSDIDFRHTHPFFGAHRL